MTRDDAIKRAINLSKRYANILLEWATGVGKSKATIDIIKEVSKDRNLNILLIVAETAHKQNWLEEFAKWDAMDLWDNVTIECYASLKNYRQTQYDILILDEGHHSGTEIRLDILRDIHTEKVIILSATFKRDILWELTNIFGEFKIFNISLTQAIENNMLPVPKVYLIPLQLDKTNYNQMISIERGEKKKRRVISCEYKDRWKYLKNRIAYPDITLNIRCTELVKYHHLTEQSEYYRRLFMRTRQEHIKNKWLRLGSERKRFLGNIKTKKVLPLLRLLEKKRYICFCASIEQAEKLGRTNSIHSEKINSLEIIQRFNDKEISNLFAVGMLQEGQNLTDIEAGVIIQLDGQEKSFIQKFGRTLRADSPQQFIFYYQNTRDEEYLEKVIENIDEDYITRVNNLTELKL